MMAGPAVLKRLQNAPPALLTGAAPSNAPIANVTLQDDLEKIRRIAFTK